jgi:UDP-N-acetylglucosamine:LPS N-acetylglucosamine transferase
MSVHPLWVHSGVDLHLAVHELPAAEARRRGALRTAVVGPLTPPVVAQPMSGALHVDAARERARLGLPDGVPLALVTGGSKGVGDLAATARDIVAGGLATPVVLCGENDILRARLQGSGEVVALGWRDDVPELMSAVDCVVQNAGGFTSLEALAAGVPTLSYRCIPGHGQTNAQALHEAGWVPWAHTPEDLERVLGQMLGRGHHGAHPAWDNRTSLDVVGVLESQMSGRPALLIPA